MRSARPDSDERTVRVRLRDSGIDLVAAEGLRALTARAVAQRAGLSAGSVINNFGSMDGLRQACDEHVARVIRETTQRSLAAGTGWDLVGALREAGLGSLLGYLAEVLREDSPAVARLVDELVADARAYLDHGVSKGVFTPTADEHGRAVVMTMWELGALTLHRHLDRLLDIDLIARTPDPRSLVALARPVMEIYGDGVFTPDFAQQVRNELSRLESSSSAQPGNDGTRVAAATKEDS